ncbi:MAG: FHA domain-containing protein [Bacteroidaceae bacterium]|nr:FHA domain-containing protein [Bacteroidaceae bacterium]
MPQKKRVKCPHCEQLLDVVNSRNEKVKTISCLKCGGRMNVQFLHPSSDDEIIPNAETVHQQRPHNVAGTIYGGKPQRPKDESNDVPQRVWHVVLRDTNTDRSYPLQMGRNIVGRASASSEADVQIDTNDRFMSRQHLLITLVPKSGLSPLKVTLQNYQNKNVTYVNGVPLDKADIVVLENGSTIKMGNSILHIQFQEQ